MARECSADKMAELSIATEEDNAAPEEDIVDPWNVQSSSAKGVDYDKLISMLNRGCCLHDSALARGY